MSSAPTIADRVVTACEGASAFTIYGGYAVGPNNGATTRFPIGAQLAERRNDKGRVTYAKYVYADGSILEYTYRDDSYRLAASRPQ